MREKVPATVVQYLGSSLDRRGELMYVLRMLRRHGHGAAVARPHLGRLLGLMGALAACASGQWGCGGAPAESPPATPATPDAAVPALPDASHAVGDAAVAPDAALDAAAPAETEYVHGSPRWLRDTGLYRDAQGELLADGVEAFRPAFELWSDGASKRRWLYLPPGTRIDTSDMDHWRYPIGTKSWKEFTRDGVRVETRLLHKVSDDPDDGWRMMAYAWNSAQTDAEAVPDGAPFALGTEHHVPSQGLCADCHSGITDKLLGPSAVQLAHAYDDSLTLAQLTDAGRLTHPPATSIALPGNALDQQALGLLHANCGNCHNPIGAASEKTALNLWLSVNALGALQDTATYQTTVGEPITMTTTLSTAAYIIVPGQPDASMLHDRMAVRADGTMPPVASWVVDDAGVATIRAWIEQLGE